MKLYLTLLEISVPSLELVDTIYVARRLDASLKGVTALNASDVLTT